MKAEMKIHKICNISEEWGNSQHSRVYGLSGIAPTLSKVDCKNIFVFELMNHLEKTFHSLGGNECEDHGSKPCKESITTKYKMMTIREKNKGKLITKEVAELLNLPREHIGKRFRIRKLTPRECFRLMDVEEEYIDKLFGAKNEKGKQLISNSQLYKMAGNSICVAPMYYIFRNAFVGIPKEEKATQPPIQLKLFQ